MTTSENSPGGNEPSNISLPQSRYPLNVELVTNDTLNMIAETLRMRVIDWDILMEMILQGNTTNTLATSLRGLLGETHVATTIQETADSNILPAHVYTDPTRDVAPSQNYEFFRPKDNRLYVRTRGSKQLVTEYDGLVRADILTVYEVKIAAKREGHSGRKHSRESFDSQFTSRTINHRFAPLEEIYGTKTFGYMVVANSDIVTTEEQMTGRRGAYVVGLPATVSEFQERAAILSRTLKARSRRKKPKAVYKHQKHK